MKVLAKTSDNDIATVYVAETEDNKLIEFVESLQPPYPIEDKWVFVISTMYGCPVGCKFCDSGWMYKGKLSKAAILDQIDYMIKLRYPDLRVPAKKFKIQFSRMGEPALNDSVLDVLRQLPELYEIKGFLPSISTVAPAGREEFFSQLSDIKNNLYRSGFQLQFSIHSTNPVQRDWLIPIKKWSFAQIADYGNKFYSIGERKITLNFALGKENELDTDVLLNYFDPEIFLIKITPVNPTYKAMVNNIENIVDDSDGHIETINNIKTAGYDVILSIGELEENRIGSNCGQHLMNYLNGKKNTLDAYSYALESI